MSAKVDRPVLNVWCIVSEGSKIDIATASANEKLCIEKFCSILGIKRTKWKSWEKSGYRCERFSRR